MNLSSLYGKPTTLPLESMSYGDLKVVFDLIVARHNLVALPKSHDSFFAKYSEGRDRAAVIADARRVKAVDLVKLMTAATAKAVQSGYEADLVVQKGYSISACDNYTVVSGCYETPVKAEVVKSSVQSFEVWDKQLVANRKVEAKPRNDAVTEEIKKGSQVYSRCRPMVGDGPGTFTIKPKVIQEISQVVKVVTSDTGPAVIAPVYTSLPEEMVTYDIKKFSEYVASVLNIVLKDKLSAIKCKADLVSVLQTTSENDIRVLYGHLTPLVPAYARGAKDCLIVAVNTKVTTDTGIKREKSQLLIGDLTSNGYRRFRDPFVVVQRLNVVSRKENRDALVCSMYDGLPLRETRPTMNLLHDLPVQLDYDVIFVETKNTAHALYVLGRVKEYKCKNKIKRNTLVVHNGVTSIHGAAADKIMNNEGLILESAVVGRGDFEWTSYDNLKYLIYMCSPNKVTQSSILGDMCSIAVKNDNDRMRCYADLGSLKPAKVIIRHILGLWHLKEKQKDGTDKIIYPSSRGYLGYITEVTEDVDYSPRTKLTVTDGAHFVARSMECGLTMLFRKETCPSITIGEQKIVVIPSHFKFPIVKEIATADNLTEFLSTQVDVAIMDEANGRGDSSKKDKQKVSSAPPPVIVGYDSFLDQAASDDEGEIEDEDEKEEDQPDDLAFPTQ